MKLNSHPLNNQKGQTLIEYLIIVALVGVGSIALMRTVSNQINAKFAHVVKSLGGTVNGTIKNGTLNANAMKSVDMKNFQKGALNNSKKDDAKDDNSEE